MASRQPSHTATPQAVLLAVPGPGLPGPSSRQVSGVAGELESSWTDVAREMEGTTQEVSWLGSSGTSVMLCTTPTSWRAHHLVGSGNDQTWICLPAAGHAAVPNQPCRQACEYRKRVSTDVLVIVTRGFKVASGICILLCCYAGSSAGSCWWSTAPHQQLEWAHGSHATECTCPAPGRRATGTCCCLSQGPGQVSQPDEPELNSSCICRASAASTPTAQYPCHAMEAASPPPVTQGLPLRSLSGRAGPSRGEYAPRRPQASVGSPAEAAGCPADPQPGKVNFWPDGCHQQQTPPGRAAAAERCWLCSPSGGAGDSTVGVQRAPGAFSTAVGGSGALRRPKSCRHGCSDRW